MFKGGWNEHYMWVKCDNTTSDIYKGDNKYEQVIYNI